MSRTGHRTIAALALTTLAGLVAAGCSGSGSAPPDDSSRLQPEVSGMPATVPGPPAPLLTAPPTVSCAPGQDKVPATLTYKTQDTTAVSILIDDMGIEAQPPTSGTYEITLPCDGNAHTIILNAFNAQLGVTSTQTSIRTVRS